LTDMSQGNGRGSNDALIAVAQAMEATPSPASEPRTAVAPVLV
jgi:hypothetical protein